MIGRAGLVVLGAAALLGCQRSEKLTMPDASVAPPPAAPIVGDGGSDARDGSSDASDAGPVTGGRRPAKKSTEAGGGGGSGGLKVTGNLPRVDAGKVVSGAAGKLRGCYEKAKAASPGLQGKVTFRLTVDDRGRVTLGEVVTTTLESGDAEMCMIRLTRDLKFPAAAGESTVTFQMMFK
jgi:hypothetical protein